MFLGSNLTSFDFDSFFMIHQYSNNLNGDYMFADCTYFEGIIPSQYFWESSHWESHNSMFRECYSIYNYDEIPSDWK